MVETAHIDFETRSTVDLKRAGLDNYARHPSTDVWCLAYALDDGPVHLWTPLDARTTETPAFSALLAHAAAGGRVVGHNVGFELAIWNRVVRPRRGWPELKTESCRCTMAMAYAMGLPGSLEKAAAAVGIQEQKDMSGHRLMLQMSQPREVKPDGTIVWWDAPDKLAKLYEYCRTDVRVEREIEKRLFPLSDAEQAVWLLDQKINARGLGIDTAAVEAALALVAAEQNRLNREMRRVTGDFVGFCTEVARLKEWLEKRSVAADGLAKADVLDLLAVEGLPADVRAALLLRQEAAKTSTAKLKTMVDAVSGDGRLRGTKQYHGAHTGRWAGRKVQPDNFPRPSLDRAEIERALDLLAKNATAPERTARVLDTLYGSPLDVVSSSLRGMLRAAPGYVLLAADFANIEGRVLAWLAGERWKLDAFRAFDAGTGPDLYKVAYARAYNRDPESVVKDERQVGKVMELALGFGGGVGAFQKMARGYGVTVSDETAEAVKVLWREAHPRIKTYWRALENAAIGAVLNPGRVFEAGARNRTVKFRVKGSFLWCLLPSGRALCYPYPRVKPKTTPWGEPADALHYMTVDGLTNKWGETDTYGGSLAENVTQAVARDLLAAALLRAEAREYPVVLHVHDEIVAEVPREAADLAAFERLCAELPPWAEGLPVAAGGWTAERYGK